jgi:hypothetical protein
MIEQIPQIDITVVAHYLITYGPKIYALLQNEKGRLVAIEEKLVAIESKIDHLIVRDIVSSFQILDALACIDSEGARDRHLTQAEANLLKNIGLDPGIKVCGRGSAYWVAKCYFGLSLIATLRQETTDAARYLLKTFVVDPRQAREEFAADFYTEMMMPHCHDIITEKEARIALLPSQNARRAVLSKELFWSRMKQGGLFAVGIGMHLLGGRLADAGRPAVGGSLYNASGDIQRIEKLIEEIPTEKSVLDSINILFDKRCQDISTKILREGSYSAQIPEQPSAPNLS